MKPVYIIRNEQDLRSMFKTAYELASQALRGGAVVLKLDRESRTLQQNAKLWPMLTDLSKQVTFLGELISPDDWKALCYQSWQEESEEEKTIRCVPSLSGRGIVMLGHSTRSLSKKQFAGLIESIYAIGTDRGVNWSEKSIDYFAEYGIN